jgi:predicted phage-related endonuclease
LIQAALEFWDDHVMSVIPPTPTTRDDVTALFPKESAGLDVEADPKTLARLRRLSRIQRLSKRLESESDQIKDQLAVSMGPAERICSNGTPLATWRCGSPTARLDVSRLRKERPDVANEYLIESPPQRRLVLGGARHA